MEHELLGKYIGRWRLERYLGAGKSAIVFEASSESRRAAVKIFDPDLVNRSGRDVQLKRVEREKRLIGARHPNLIEILDGGEDSSLGYLFVVMTLLPWPNVADALPEIPRENTRSLIKQLAEAAHFLEQRGLAHRDIKPENIVVSEDFQSVVLLDLGVLRTLGDEEKITDQGHKVFVGTRQYSPPEMLFRNEEDTTEGWRAITFYQLGAVLYDLLQRKPLFHDRYPDARMVEAVKSERPVLTGADIPSDLRTLALNCLEKDPRQRLKLVTWNDFLTPPNRTSALAARERIAARQARVLAFPNNQNTPVSGTSRALMQRVQRCATNAVTNLLRGGTFPPVHQEHTPDLQAMEHRFLARFEASSLHSLAYPLWIEIRFKLDSVDALAITITASATLAETIEFGDAPTHYRTCKSMTLEEGAVTCWIEEFAICALDAAQNACESGVAAPPLSLKVATEGQ
ncbi:MAG: serine/threonine-protein kinase [Polyangiaceae bacterium]